MTTRKALEELSKLPDNFKLAILEIFMYLVEHDTITIYTINDIVKKHHPHQFSHIDLCSFLDMYTNDGHVTFNSPWINSQTNNMIDFKKKTIEELESIPEGCTYMDFEYDDSTFKKVEENCDSILKILIDTENNARFSPQKHREYAILQPDGNYKIPDYERIPKEHRGKIIPNQLFDYSVDSPKIKFARLEHLKLCKELQNKIVDFKYNYCKLHHYNHFNNGQNS